ncbi:protein FAM208B [Protobothrops mucrosquamatus]|uniref:protein FAM208B n=1 Tax=Protobothrops mucrosquamatus TaxID=103944 RepID=UPI0010FAEB0D|nr:protein FAM208B [Protobothrops mucrosquamatus]
MKPRAEHEMKVLHRAWEGQLFIQHQQVCHIVLRSPFQASLPAQLPAKLEFKYIVRISELRKKLPEAAFKKNSYSNDEVCCQQLSFRLYQVEILDESELKDQLIGSMKEKNLALVKYVNDRGILLFLTSSILAKGKGKEGDGRTVSTFESRFRVKRFDDSPSFVFISIARALAEAAKNPELSPSNALVKLHMEEFAKLNRSSAPSRGNASGPTFIPKLSSETPKGDPVDDKCSPSSFSKLAFYLSDPESYTLEVSSALACLQGGSRPSDGGADLNLDSSPLDGPDKATRTGQAPLAGTSKGSPPGERSLPWTKRKSSRILGASSKKKWSPLKMYCMLENSRKKTKEKEKRKKKKKKKNLPKEAVTLSIPVAKDLGCPTDPKKPTLKLKNIQNPLRRKRGAEVLSAEFIQGPSASPEGATEASGGPATEEKKPRLTEVEKAMRNVDNMDAKRPTPRKNVHGVSSEKQRIEAISIKNDVAAVDALRTSTGEECDSHALNLLADLALSSCNAPLDRNGRRDFGRFRPSREHCLPRGKFLHKSSDHEYHRATKKWKGTFLPGQTSRSSFWSARETGRDRDWPSNVKDRNAVNPSKKKNARIDLTKSSLALPNETGDLSDSGVMISLEHSYASPISETPPKGTPRSPDSRNGVKQDKPGPLVGKVLPFQHQQNSCQPGKPVTNHLSPARLTLMAARLREDFSGNRQVTSCDKTVQVTFQWEAKYPFNLDSKYTNNSLEKTILRAVHGPWDESLSDNMEDMRLILHMWMALFYSKKFQALTIRKVVEHSNPAKYVSLNSLVDPLEPMDGGGGGGGAYILEKGSADSVSEAVQILAEGGEDGSVSPSQKLLSCNKLSSTDSLVEESPLTKLEETTDLLEKEERSRPLLKPVEEVVEAEPKKQPLLHPVLPIENLPGVDEGVNPPTCQTKADRSEETKLIGPSQNDALVSTGLPNGSGNEQPIASTEVAVSVTDRRIDVGSSSEEVKKDDLLAGGPKLGTSEAVGFKEDVTSREPASPGSKVQNQPRLHTDQEEGESMDLGSIDPVLSERNDANMEVQDMDLVSEDEEDLEENDVKRRKETDGMWDETSSRQDLLPSRASPDTLSGHRTEFQTVPEAAVGPSSSSVSPNQMGLIEMVPQQASSLHPMTVEEKMAGSAKKMDPTSPRQIDKVEDSHDEAILADSVSIQASGDFPNDLATDDGPLQSQQESVESPRVPNQVDPVDLSSVSQEDNRIRLSCLPSWQASPVHQRASDEEPPRIQKDHLENPLYRIFQSSINLIEDISQDSTELTDPSVPLCEPNSDLCLNSVPNSTPTLQELVENQESSIASTQGLSLAKEMDLVENPEGEDHPASPLQRETSDEAAKLQEDSNTKLDLPENSAVPEEKDAVHPMDNVSGRVNDPQLVEFDFGTQEEQTVSRGEKILVNSQPTEESLSLELHDVESETSFKNETCLGQENIRDSSAREEAASEDEVEKSTVTTAAVAEEVHALMNELVAMVCATIAQSEETRAQKSLDWINLDMLESVTPPESDDEGSSTVQHSHADVKCADECLEQISTFDDQQEDLQARVQEEWCSSSNENTASDPGDVFEKEELQENDATSAATGIFSSCGTNQEELGTTNPKGRWLWLETTDYGAKVDDHGTSTLEKVEQTKINPEEPICNRDDHSIGEDVENPSFVPAEGQEDSLAEEPDPLVDGDSKQAPDHQEDEAQVEAKECLGSLEDPLRDERTQLTTNSSSMDVDWGDESLTAESSQDPCVDWYPTSKLESLDQPRFKASPSIESEFTCSSGPGKESCKDGDWVSSEASQKASDAGSTKHNFPFGLKKEDWSLWLSLDEDHKPEHFKDYINFSVTKKHKEKTRTFHSFSKEHSPFSRGLGSINSWSRNWGFLSNPIQNIVDLESVRFHCRIREILKRSQQRSTSRVLPTKKVPPQGIGVLGVPSRTVSEGTIARFPVRSRSPLLVTVANSNPRTGGRREDFCSPFPATQDPFGPAVAPRSQFGLGPKRPIPSLHLQELTYHKLNNFSRDISSVVEEFAEFSRVMAFDRMRTCNPERDPTTTSGEAGEKRYLPQPPRTLGYEDLLAALRNTLHFQLTNVAQEACRKPFSFYVMETEDDPFFGRVKNLLKRGGHTEVDLLQLRKGSDVEMGNLLVIVRNEDIFLHIHKVPSLLRLKRCPNVTFAGVDSPEDALAHTYQELFHSGGFVVSDDDVLQGMSVGELKDVIKTLEKLNSHGRWKWFLHYQESKKLKEDARGDPAAYTKESVLKSCQVANLAEVLHYHVCDSRSCTRFERLNCLLNLQIQHITRRFAVFLTENASACREALEDKGILRLDITGFITAAPEMVAPFRSGFWVHDNCAACVSWSFRIQDLLQ